MFAHVILTSALIAHAPDTSLAPEVGRVDWGRDLEAALANQAGKPALVLFQEVPG